MAQRYTEAACMRLSSIGFVQSVNATYATAAS